MRWPNQNGQAPRSPIYHVDKITHRMVRFCNEPGFDHPLENNHDHGATTINGRLCLISLASLAFTVKSVQVHASPSGLYMNTRCIGVPNRPTSVNTICSSNVLRIYLFTFGESNQQWMMEMIGDSSGKRGLFTCKDEYDITLTPNCAETATATQSFPPPLPSHMSLSSPIMLLGHGIVCLYVSSNISENIAWLGSGGKQAVMRFTRSW